MLMREKHGLGGLRTFRTNDKTQSVIVSDEDGGIALHLSRYTGAVMTLEEADFLASMLVRAAKRCRLRNAVRT